jgi:hypothetical protein
MHIIPITTENKRVMRVMLVGAVAALFYYYLEKNFKTWFEA